MKHFIQVRIGPLPEKNTLEQLNAEVDDWVAEHSEWIDDTEPHELFIAEGDAGTRYWLGNYRFYLEDPKDNLLQKCEDKLTDKVAYYRLGYHQCAHDEDPAEDCTWDDAREWTEKDVTIPADVPEYTVETSGSS